MEPTTWKDFTKGLVLGFCNDRGSRTFTLQELLKSRETEILNFRAENKHPFDKIRQQLQYLREDGVLSFVDNRGTYTLRKPEILENELSDKGLELLQTHDCEKKEYLRETYTRDRGWVKEAKNKLGSYCLHPNCSNTFKKNDRLPYIEVHHIIPLFEGGEDAIWNLAVVCAHHHKMAHFADDETRDSLKRIFLAIVEQKL